MRSKPSYVLVTGASGFIGGALCQRLLNAGSKVRAAVRKECSAPALPHGVESCVVGEVGNQTSWVQALRDARTVIHLVSGTPGVAASHAPLLDRYRAVNVEGTRTLAAAAAACGVERFVFVSSIKVHGEKTAENQPFTETDCPAPQDAYAHSKWEAEQVLEGFSRDRCLPLTVLRPPIVYGPAVKGNLLALMHAIHRGIPLPLASIRNRRSLIAVDNLADAVVACVKSPLAAGKTYLVSDGEDVSTPELIRALAQGLRRRARLFPFPVTPLRVAAQLLGRRAECERLTGFLQVNSSKIRRELAWTPPWSLAQGLEQMARWYRERDLGNGSRARGNE